MRHVGKMIKAELDKHPKAHTVTWFANELHCKRTNVYDIFNRQTVDTELLLRISRILGHDFFRDLSDDLSAESDAR
ncbi:MAG: XRE family transcriptional regulator [Bacteroidaceae bacterium]|nr:XRE family transcriptional regulator [Bacteroidaceae bacterium]